MRSSEGGGAALAPLAWRVNCRKTSTGRGKPVPKAVGVKRTPQSPWRREIPVTARSTRTSLSAVPVRYFAARGTGSIAQASRWSSDRRTRRGTSAHVGPTEGLITSACRHATALEVSRHHDLPG